MTDPTTPAACYPARFVGASLNCAKEKMATDRIGSIWAALIVRQQAHTLGKPSYHHMTKR